MKPFSCYSDTLAQAAVRLRSRTITSRALVEQCLKAIARREADVHAWVFVDEEEARRQADAADAEIAGGNYRGPLHGIPIAIKDIFDVAGWPTAAGFAPWKHQIAEQDAHVVASLREAGAVFLGKTVTTQFASFDPPVTRNPWNLECTPGGSSSGSAAAVACGMCFAALASQTGGSITRPAAYCGVAGIKPSYAGLPLGGIVPLAHSMDHPGAIARSVADLEYVVRAMGIRERLLQREPASPPPRLGRLRGHFEEPADPVVTEAMEIAVERLMRAGIAVVEVPLPPGFANVLRSHRTIMAVEAAAWHEIRLQQHTDQYLPRIRQLVEEGLATQAVDYSRARVHKGGLLMEVHKSMHDSGVIALLAPAATTPAPRADTTGDPAFNSPWSFTGQPVVSFPVAWTADELPLSVQLVGRMFKDGGLFAVAEWCERVIQTK